MSQIASIGQPPAARHKQSRTNNFATVSYLPPMPGENDTSYKPSNVPVFVEKEKQASLVDDAKWPC